MQAREYLHEAVNLAKLVAHRGAHLAALTRHAQLAQVDVARHLYRAPLLALVARRRRRAFGEGRRVSSETCLAFAVEFEPKVFARGEEVCAQELRAQHPTQRAHAVLDRVILHLVPGLVSIEE